MDVPARISSAVGLPSCASSTLSGLYGLELRAVTAAINASILPIALRTADFVERGVQAAGITAPVMVMRGDGGATDLAGFRSAPARTLYSGPAASVAGALRHTGVSDGVVIEIGGTSTNVAGLKYGRPALSYVQVASHPTALRAVDVRVVGVAGGSMLRLRKGRVHGVGPRSAHIAGLGYACFADAATLAGATVRMISPRPGDAADYVSLETPGGAQLALTTTCAAVLLGVPEPDDYCMPSAGPAAARVAFEIVGRHVGLAPDEVARRMLTAAGEAVCELVLGVAASNRLTKPVLIGVGGGAGGLARWVARMLGSECRVPEGAEVISSIGDALSLLRAEKERTVENFDRSVVQALMDDVEAEVVAAGAEASSVEITVEEQADKGTVRAVATGAVALQAGALPGRAELDEDAVLAIAEQYGGGRITRAGRWWLAVQPKRVVVFDRFGAPAAEIQGAVTTDATAVPALVEQHTRYRGPVTLRPSAWVLDGARMIELSSGDVAAAVNGFAVAGGAQTYIVGRN